MINDIINYGIRILIILLGLVFVSGYFMPEDSDPTMMRVFGIIFVLFGFYRLALYRANKKRYSSKNDKN
jgi:hypothetical protein